jgi:mono/diheme cytochrome c family protein
MMQTYGAIGEDALPDKARRRFLTAGALLIGFAFTRQLRAFEREPDLAAIGALDAAATGFDGFVPDGFIRIGIDGRIVLVVPSVEMGQGVATGEAMMIAEGWKLLFLGSKPFEPDPARGVAWNRGAYLVNGLAHCSECHTPRNLMFARKQHDALSGGIVDGWKAWNITPDKETGIGLWTDAQLVSYLSTGYVPGHGAASGSMHQAIDLSLSQLPVTDIEAIVAYLRTLTPRRADAAAALMPASAAVKASTAWSPGGEAGDGTGRRIFEGACASCHAWNGNGQQTARAGLAGSHAVNDPQGANLIRVILEGASAPDHAAATAMPSFGAAYTDAEIAAVANYAITHSAASRGRSRQRASRTPGPEYVQQLNQT